MSISPPPFRAPRRLAFLIIFLSLRRALFAPSKEAAQQLFRASLIRVYNCVIIKICITEL